MSPVSRLADTEPEAEKSRPLSVAERLAAVGEYFIDGSPDKSDRDARKSALYAHWDERQRQRQEKDE